MTCFREVGTLRVNASIEKDYMHDFETKGEGQEAEEGDKALVRLAKQGPWWVQNRMMYQFFEGKKSIASVKDGYLGANSYGEEEQEEEEDGSGSPGSEDGTPQPINGVKEYNVLGLAKIGRIVNEGVSVVHRQADDGTWWSTLFNRMSCSGNVQFPMIVQRGVNDKFEYVVNDELRVSGSILPDGVDEMYIDFPYEKGERDYEHEGEESSMSDGTEIDQNIHRYYCNKFNDSRYAFMNALRRMFEPVFNFDFRDSSGESTNPPFLKTFSYTMVGDLIETIQNDDNGRNVNVVTKTIAFTLYGSTRLDVEGLKIDIMKAQHSDPTNVGFIFHTEHGTVSYVSDTEFTEEIAQQYIGTRVLILPVTTPMGNRIKYHLCTDDAIKFIDIVKPELAIFIHLGVVIIKRDPEKEAAMTQEATGIRTVAGHDLMVLDVGEELQLSDAKTYSEPWIPGSSP